MRSRAAAFAEPEAGEEGTDRRRSAPCSARISTSTRTSRRATGRGGSASPSCRTPTCSRRSRSGKASVVTDEIDRFTENGILLKSGRTLDADIIVTATGFNLNILGDIDFEIDGKPLDFAEHRHLSRHDVHGRSEHGLGVRLFPRQLDTAHRPGGGVRLPASNAYEEQRRAQGGAGAAAGGSTTCRCCSWIDPENFNPDY